MSARDEQFGVGIYRDEISTESIERAHQTVLDCARALSRELSSRSVSETLSDAEVDLINAFAVLEGYKLKPMAETKQTIGLGSLEEHERLAAHFAEASHKFESPISDALSGLAEAHQQYADALRRLAAPSEEKQEQ